ncbi:hypothetical protein P9112_009129 [Eukaryota sp. TZLM1-RC]
MSRALLSIQTLLKYHIPPDSVISSPSQSSKTKTTSKSRPWTSPPKISPRLTPKPSKSTNKIYRPSSTSLVAAEKTVRSMSSPPIKHHPQSLTSPRPSSGSSLFRTSFSPSVSRSRKGGEGGFSQTWSSFSDRPCLASTSKPLEETRDYSKNCKSRSPLAKALRLNGNKSFQAWTKY